jgi:uncharacterized protein YcsI (UPF0317 family)
MPASRPKSGNEALRERAREVRGRIRRGEWRTQTSGCAPGVVQGNVAILPRDWATDFLRFCRANPKPCPILTVSEPGDPYLRELGGDIDIRTDLPRYRVFRDGVETDEVASIERFWRDDLVTFVLGCSFSFEEALIAAGVPLRHIEEGTDVAVFRTSIATTPAGPFRGPLVVSMRPFTPAHAIRAIQITSRFPNVHGAPVHFGDPAAIGIADIARPDWGDAVPVKAGETPVFWACGVTPQTVIAEAKPPLCITHKPSHMLVTDLLNAELAVL